MKILITILLSIFCIAGYGQTYTTIQALVLKLKQDSIADANYKKINERDKQGLSALITVEQNNYSSLKPTSYISINSAKELDVKVPQITAEILAKVPAPQQVDLKPLTDRIAALEQSNNSAQQKIIQLYDVISILIDKSDSAAIAITLLQMDNYLLKQHSDSIDIALINSNNRDITLFANYQTFLDSLTSQRAGLVSLNTLFKGLSAAVWTNMKRVEKRLDSLIIAGKSTGVYDWKQIDTVANELIGLNNLQKQWANKIKGL